MIKRKFFFLVLLFLLSFTLSKYANAQKSNEVRVGIGVDAGTTIKDPARFTLGADARLQFPFGNSVSGILTTGYYQFFKKDYYPGFGIVPVKAGLKYFPAKNVYIAGEAGIGVATKGTDNISFVYSPSVGLAFGNGLDVSIKLEDYTKFELPQVALRLAYGFKL